MDNNVEIFQSEKDQKWYFHIKADNGLVVAQSQGYKDKRNAAKGLLAVAKAFSPEANPSDPDTPPALAFARAYAPLLAKWRAGLSVTAIQQHEVTLVDIVLRALDDGWQITPPADTAEETKDA